MRASPPVLMAYHKGGKRLHIGAAEFKDDLVKKTEALSSSYVAHLVQGTTRSSSLTFGQLCPTFYPGCNRRSRASSG